MNGSMREHGGTGSSPEDEPGTGNSADDGMEMSTPRPSAEVPAASGTRPEASNDRDYWALRHRRLAGLKAVGYQSKSPGFNRWMYRVRQRTTTDLIDRLLGRGRRPVRVLDVGSGAGFYVDLWSERPEAAELVGLDVSPEAIDSLRRAFPSWDFHTAEVGGSGELPVEGQFDLVQCFDVLYHITDDMAFQRALVQLGQRVRPGGHLLVTDNFPRRDVTTRRHVRLRSIESYLDVLKDFRAVAVTPQFLFLNVPSGVVAPALRWPLVIAWESLTWPARFDPLGRALGAVLYILDRALLPLVGDRTPSTKLVAFQRLDEARMPGPPPPSRRPHEADAASF